jgi:hypothetical protein
MTDYMIADKGGDRLGANGKSDYPDLFIKDYDYSAVPRHTRSVKEYGAALKGKEARPVRVPDGIEIKTCRNGFRVDCHYGHMGLHVALYYTENKGRAEVCDLDAAFLRASDYANATRNTDATTAKASFGPERFVSLLPGGCVTGTIKKGRSSTNANLF